MSILDPRGIRRSENISNYAFKMSWEELGYDSLISSILAQECLDISVERQQTYVNWIKVYIKPNEEIGSYSLFSAKIELIKDYVLYGSKEDMQTRMALVVLEH